MSRFPRLALLAVALATTCAGPLFAAPAKPAPNLVVIMTDDQGYADAGFNGGTEIPTPNLDRIAAGGVRFTNAYVTYAVCSPSRAGFMTGRYPQRFGYERNVAFRPHDPAAGLSLRETTLAEALRPAGYTSAAIGKWHLGSHDNFHPLNRGFDEFFGHLGGGLNYFPEKLTIRDYREAKNESESYRTWIVRNREPVQTTRYLTEEFTHEALDFVRRQKNNRFFLYLAYNAPHTPMQAPEEEIAKFAHIPNEKRRTYAAMLSVVDRGVGQLLDLLDELQIADNTLVFFLSDNGGPTADNGSRNAPLRGAKGSPFEGGFRVPFAARWPGVFPAGATYEKPVSSLDIFATIAAANQLVARTDRPLDGVDLVPFVRDGREGAPHPRIYLRNFDRGAFAIREGDHKLVRTEKDQAPMLFNLGADISERRDLAAAEPERVQTLLGTYETWNAQLIEPAFPGLPRSEWNAKDAK
jgi:arylsulfatase A-like enzyme